jgi:flavodoxin
MNEAEAPANKVLVIVYSYTGTSRRVAELLRAQHGWPVAHIHDARPRSGVLGGWRCVLDAMLRRQPEIRYDGPPPSDYDAVVLVSPIWLLQLAGPMRSFVARQHRRLRKVAVLSVMGGEGEPDAAAEIGELLGRAPVLSAAVTRREVNNGRCAQRLQAFGDALGGGENQRAAVHPAALSPQSI